MKEGHSERVTTAIVLATVVAVALALRVSISYHVVFSDVPAPDLPARFIEPDAWYHMRLVDAAIRHFFHRIWFDPYLVFPGGEPVNAGPFFDWVIASAAMLLGKGAPSQDLVDVVGAYTPVVFGALFPIPVYVLGKHLFSRRAGLWAALIVAVLPGQILTRSVLGFTDHHCAEILLTTAALMWIVLALDGAIPRSRRLVWSTVARATLGCYLLTWGGGSLFVVVIAAAAATSLIVDRLRGSPNNALALVLVPAFAIPAIMIIPWLLTRPYFLYDAAALAGSVLLLFATDFWGRVTVMRPHGDAMYVGGLASGAGCVVVATSFLHGAWPALALEIGRLSPWRASGYVAEAAPLLKSYAMRPVPLWNEFAACTALAVIGVGAFATRARASSPTGLLLMVWTIAMIGATFGQVRFTYYLGVNVALFAGFACDEALLLMEAVRPVVRREAAIAVLLLVTIPVAERIYQEWGVYSSMSDDWYDALRWLRSNSPEPFGTDEAFYRTDVRRSLESEGSAAYGVLALWEYGYWITRVAHRIPNTNPKQTQVAEVTAFLLADTPQEASAVLKRLGSRYVIVDSALQAWVPDESSGGEQNGLFATIADSAGKALDAYCQGFEVSAPDQSPRTQVYCFPKYYRTMAVRLYAFGGRRVVPQAVTAISWTVQNRGNSRVRVLVGQESFRSAEEAARFIASRPSEHWEVASADPLKSCVTLDELPGYTRVFQSIGHQGGRSGPAVVQIYEYQSRS